MLCYLTVSGFVESTNFNSLKTHKRYDAIRYSWAIRLKAQSIRFESSRQNFYWIRFTIVASLGAKIHSHSRYYQLISCIN